MRRKFAMASAFSRSFEVHSWWYAMNKFVKMRLQGACTVVEFVPRRLLASVFFIDAAVFAVLRNHYYLSLHVLSGALASRHKKSRYKCSGFFRFGSPRRARTADPVINSHLLYRLSYRGITRAES